MKVLSVDTAEQGCSIAIVEDGVPLAVRFESGLKNHSVTLMPMISQLVGDAGSHRLKDLDGFIVSRGPGSFTGLRIGISTVKGLAMAAGRPVAGISTLDGVAWRLSHADRPVCAMLDARRKEVYCAVYRFSRGRLTEKSREMALSPGDAVRLAGPDALFVGSGAAVYGPEIRNRLKQKGAIAPAIQHPVGAEVLAHVFFQDPDTCPMGDPATLMPVYIRRSDAEIHFRKRN